MRRLLQLCVVVLLFAFAVSSAWADDERVSWELTPGVPFYSNIVAGNWQYFRVPLTGETKALTVVITPLGDGDPDLYLDLGWQWVNASAPFRARGWGEDSVTLTPTQLGAHPWAFVGVLGYTNCTYTVLSTFKSTVRLVPGVPQTGSITTEASDFYNFTVPAGRAHGDLTISVTPLNGGMVQLYIGTVVMPTPAVFGSYHWYSQPGVSKLTIYRNDEFWPSVSGVFFITVSALSDCNYVIAAATNDTAMALRDGVPLQDHVEALSSDFFSFRLGNVGCDLVVQVTPFSGDPDLFISRTSQRPSATDYERKSDDYGYDSITWKDAPPALYYIAIYAFQNTTFTILAHTECGGNHTEDFVRLIDGVPQSGALEESALRFYRLDVQGEHSDVTISLTRRYGDPDLYIRNDGLRPGPSSYQWSATAFGEDLITIVRTDPQWCTHCQYYIAVYASSNCSYTIRASTSQTIVQLQLNIPVRESLRANEYDYFQITMSSWSLQPLVVTVTDLGTGDPDIYMSTSNPRPNITNHMWSSQLVSSDAISIPITDPNYCMLCTYYISVLAYSNTTFTIVANTERAVDLVDGNPQSGQVARGAMKFYQIWPAHSDQDLTFTLSNSHGESNLFISNTEYPEADKPETYQWSSYWYTGAVKSVIIRSGESTACRWFWCEYYVAVYGVTNSTYSLVAASGKATIPLQPFYPQREHVETGQWQYFSVRVDNSNYDLAISVTALSGDPDVYVSHLTTRPNETYYEKRATQYGSDSVDFEPAAVATYYIGVKAFENSTFSILALVTDRAAHDNATVVRLYDGEPSQNVLQHSHYFYYYLELTGTHSDLTIVLTREYGDPDLYINMGWEVFPTTRNHRWSSASSSSDVVRIDGPLAGVYVIGVYAYSTTGFTVTATSSTGVTTLQDGVAIRGELQLAEYRYYRLPVDSSARDSEITITVTTFSGDPDLFVSTRVPRPSARNYTWAADSYRDDAITITRTDPNFCAPCTYYISVYSFSASSYSIMASFAREIALVDGQPQSGSVAKEAFVYYKLRVSDAHSDITISVTPLSGNPMLFISTNDSFLPTRDSYQWRSWQWSGGATVDILATDPHFCINCIMYIGVYGASASDYSIVATTTHQVVQLRAGIPVRDSLNQGKYEYFTFSPAQAGVDVTFIVTAITGDPDVYASTIYRRPNATASEWRSNGQGDDQILITNSPRVTYYIGVFGWSNSTFTITAYELNSNDTRTTLVLVDGVPQNGQVAYQDWTHYHFYLVASHEDLTITVTRRSGDPDLYISNDGDHPNMTHWQWSSTAFGADMVTIPNPVPGEYLIGIYGFQAASYIIVASTGSTILTLLDGVPFREDLQAGRYEYFQLPMDRTDRDLTVTVTSFNGDPDLFMSDTVERPSLEEHTWAARSFREDSITIPSSIIHRGVYFISVQAWSNCTFTIIASFASRVVLQDGVPQSGVVVVEQAKYYELAVNNEPHDYISFFLTPYVGSAFLFVGTDPSKKPIYNDPTTYIWSSLSWAGSQQITVHRGERGMCRECTYFVMVYGRTAANFSLVAQTSVSTVTLQNGVPQSSWLMTGRYGYFQIRVDSPRAALIISVTPVSGDPDLYVSAITQRPTVSNYTWSAQMSGADTVGIDYTDPDYVWSNGARSGTYYIGVYAWENTTFSLVASIQDLSDNGTHEMTLINGQPQTGFLRSNTDTRLYTFFVTERHDVTITVTPRYGDPDMYIRNDGQTPSENYYQWAAAQWGMDSITIPAKEGCVNCYYSILVKAWEHTLYSIVARTGDAATQLENGVPFTGSLVTDASAYYYLVVDNPDELVITCNGLTGDPDLYVSTHVQFPNATAYDWRSIRSGTDILTINATAAGRYYIAVRAWTTTTYILTATIGPVTLIEGQPHDDVLFQDDKRHYMFHVNDRTNAADVVFALSLNNDGRAIMYISLNNTQPSAADFQWSSQDTSTSDIRNIVVIPAADAKTAMCRNNNTCTYYITVLAVSDTVVYSLTGTNTDKGVMLIPGQPVLGSVQPQKLSFFRAFVDQAAYDVSIDLTTYSGDIQVYVSVTNPYPDARDYNWTSGHDLDSRGDHIGIDHTAPSFRTGMYYIGVYGYESSKYSIVLATGRTMLRPGVPQIAAVQSGGTYFFLAMDQASTSDILIYVGSFESQSGSDEQFEVYVSYNNTHPDVNGFTWYRKLKEGDVLQIRQNDPWYRKGATYFIGVTAPVVGLRFTLKVSLADSVDVLFDDAQEVRGVVAQSKYKYYEMFVQSAMNFSLTLEPCTGNADLYMSQSTFLPTRQMNDWSSTQTDRIDTIRVQDPRITRTTFFVGVYGEKGDIGKTSQFKIYASSKSEVPVPKPGGDHGASILTSTPGAGQVTLRFRRAVSGLAKYDNALKYMIFYAREDAAIVMYSYCGLDKSSRFSKDTFNDNSAFIERTVNGLDKGVVYLFNVVVQDPDGNRAVYTVREQMTTTDTPQPADTSTSTGTVLGIVIPTFGVTLAVIAALIIKNRKLTKELEIEMHDVPKAAVRKAVRGPEAPADEEKKPGKTAKKYSPLLNDDDDEPAPMPDDGYAPPAGGVTTGDPASQL